MQQQEKTLESWTVIGISTRTTNADEASGAGKIPALWGRFYSENISQKIPGKIDATIVAIYHDYESDANGPYTLTIGIRVAADRKPAEGLTLLNIPRQKYTIFTTERGVMPDIVIKAWGKIWGSAGKVEISRAYTYDFELYDQRATDPAASQVDIYIAIK